MKDCSASYAWGKLRKYSNQRLEFPAPETTLDYLRKMLKLPQLKSATVNGIFWCIHKIGPNPRCSFNRGYSHTGNIPDWQLVFRDVVVKFEKDGEICETYLPWGRRWKNGQMIFLLCQDFGVKLMSDRIGS